MKAHITPIIKANINANRSTHTNANAYVDATAYPIANTSAHIDTNAHFRLQAFPSSTLSTKHVSLPLLLVRIRILMQILGLLPPLLRMLIIIHNGRKQTLGWLSTVRLNKHTHVCAKCGLKRRIRMNIGPVGMSRRGGARRHCTFKLCFGLMFLDLF